MILFLILGTPIIASILLLLVRKNISTLSSIAIIASCVEVVATLAIAGNVLANGLYGYTQYLSVDALAALIMLTISVTACAASFYSAGYMNTEVKKKIIGFNKVKQYFVLLQLFIFAMIFAVTTTNPILMWISIEATTLSTAFLISFYNKPSATEAAWKYLIINSVGLLLGFFGTILFLYPAISAGHEGLISWQVLRETAPAFVPFITKFAFIFVLIGYGTKVGLVPMHTWRPDAYSKAPIPVVALFSASLLNVAFLAILRFKTIADSALGSDFSSKLLIFFGLISIVVAAFNIFGQKNYKRMLAYSSIEHAGIMALGFGFGGVGAFAAVLHMVYHSLSKSILFLSAGNIFLKYSSTKMVNVKGVISVLPVTGVLFMIGFLAATGIPPFGIFITEFSILAAGLSHHLVAIVIAIAAIALVFVGFLRHVVSMLFGQGEVIVKKGEAGVWTIAPIVVLVVLLVVLSVYLPASLNTLITAATAQY